MSKKVFKRKELQNKDEIFFSLAPRDDVDEKNIYFNSFMEAIKHKNKIIAFTGRYGIGKTSIINSILKKLDNSYKSIRISLGNYKQATGDETNIVSNEIETKILQQIIYTIDENKLPLSRFKRIKYISGLKKISLAIISCFIMLCINFYFPEVYEAMLTPLYNFFHQYLSDSIIFIIYYIYFIVIFLCIYKLISIIQIYINTLALKYKDLEISFSNNDEKSVFNKYLDEIVYFFKQTKTKILIIEDLDRYEKISLEIFKKLKELNFMLNSNETISKNGGVIFIYALRDDLFLNPEDRVKFFDNIIPVVSKFSSQNAKQYIMELYKKIQNKYELTINENLFSILSLHIQDRRLLNNIFMEFKMYIDVLKDNQDIDYTQLFAIISYKNIKPSDFDKRLEYDGDLYNIFNSKKEFIRMLINELIENNNQIVKEINDAKSQKIKDLKDLKKSFLLDILKNEYFNNYINKTKIYIGEQELSLDGFINSEINIEDLRNKDISCNFSSYNTKSIEAKIKNEFLDKVEKLDYEFEKMEEKIIYNKELIEKYKEMSMEEILNIDSINELLSNDDNYKELLNNKILISLVKNGFIKENYENNLSYFKSGDLTQMDYSFLIMVDTNEKANYNYELKNVEKIVNIIQAKDFNKETVLNFYICDYLINNISSLKKQKFYSQFKQMNNYKLKFLDEYCNYNEINFTKVLQKIFDNELILYFFNNLEIITNNKKWLKLILENIKLDLKENCYVKLKEFLEQNVDFLNKLKINETSILNINYLKPSFKDYDEIVVAIIDIFYNNKFYVPNKSFYDKLIDLYEIDNYYKDADVIDMLFENDNFTNFKDKLIESNSFAEFYNSFKIYDSKELNILKAINSSNLNKKEKILILEKENENITNINDIEDTSLWKEIITENYINISMKNILCYYNEVGEIDEVIQYLLSEIGNDYNVINDDNFKDFESKMIYSTSNSLINYKIIAEKFDYIISLFNYELEINEEFVEELINFNKVDLNIDTYNYLFKKNIILLSKLVVNKYDDYLNLKNNIEHDTFIIDEIINSNIDINKKIQLLDVIDISIISKKGLSYLINEIIKNNIFLNDSIVEQLFFCLEIKDKINYFIYLHKSNPINIKYLYEINERISKIRNGVTTSLSFENVDYMYTLMNYLQLKGIINNCEIKKNKIRVTYNKTKI